MASPRTRTALYSEQARQDLAAAVIKAREYAGWPTTVDFIKAVGRGSRAIYALENAEPTVGQVILHAVGRTLGTQVPGWSQDTPREILEGSPPPPLTPAGPDVDSTPEVEPPSEEDEPWTEEDERVYDALAALVGHKRLRLRVVQAIKEEAERRDTDTGDRNSSDTAS